MTYDQFLAIRDQLAEIIDNARAPQLKLVDTPAFEPGEDPWLVIRAGEDADEIAVTLTLL